MDKIFIDANELLRDSFQLGLNILQSGFLPTHIVGVWRGGTPVGIAVQEILAFHRLKTDHIAIRTSSYYGIEKQSDAVKVYGLDYLVDTMNAEDRLLIVDDVFDSGRSVRAIIQELTGRCRKNLPEEIKVATVYFKPSKNKTDRLPDFYLHETEKWLVFPHELDGLTLDEIMQHKPIDPNQWQSGSKKLQA